MTPLPIKANSKVWLEDSEGNYLMGPRTARLLQAVDDLGSLSAAAKEVGFSYRAAWNRIKRVEETLGTELLITNIGGPGGGGSALSEQARSLVERFISLNEANTRLLRDLWP